MNEITLYWAPANTIAGFSSWDMLYSEPESLSKSMIANRTSNGIMKFCPASNDLFRNIFQVKSTIDDFRTLIPGQNMAASSINEEVDLGEGGKVRLYSPRVSSIKGYVSASYNLSWQFFASEPLKIKFTAPYYPASTPTENALLSAGVFDAGRWFRSVNLDYHLPIDSTKFQISKGQPLFYLEALTEKRIKLQRFTMSPRLQTIATEVAEASKRYGPFRNLSERYDLATKAKLPEIILNEIAKNLIT